MRPAKKILCVIDATSCVHPGLRRAEWYARNARADLELLVCFYDEYLSGQRFFDPRLLVEARNDAIAKMKAYLNELAVPLRNSGITVHTSVIWDRPLHEGIVRHTIASQADVVFKGTHRSESTGQHSFSSSDWSLILHCPTPLWLVKPRKIQEKPLILASIDPTHSDDRPASLDDRILNASSSVARLSNGLVHAFHCYDPRVALATATTNAYIPVSLANDEIERDMRERHQDRFEEVTALHGLSEDRKHLISGRTHQTLPDIAGSLNADIVVMGAIGRNTEKHLYLGTTAEQAVEHIPCDLLLIKPDWFSAPVNTR